MLWNSGLVRNIDNWRPRNRTPPQLFRGFHLQLIQHLLVTISILIWTHLQLGLQSLMKLAGPSMILQLLWLYVAANTENSIYSVISCSSIVAVNPVKPSIFVLNSIISLAITAISVIWEFVPYMGVETKLTYSSDSKYALWTNSKRGLYFVSCIETCHSSLAKSLWVLMNTLSNKLSVIYPSTIPRVLHPSRQFSTMYLCQLWQLP